MMEYLAIDPGNTTGWAAFDVKGDLLTFGQVDEADFNRWIRRVITPRLTAVICEDYRIGQGKQMMHTGSRVPTIKKIGSIESECEAQNVILHLQPNNVKSTGYAWGGIVPPSNHGISHQYDAYAHGVYFLQKRGIRKPGQGLNLEKA